MAYDSSKQRPNTAFVAGVVPDGVHAVSVVEGGGNARAIQVHENVYTALVHGTARLSFAGSDGDVNLGVIETLWSHNRHRCAEHPTRCQLGAQQRATRIR